ncbi:putative lipoprotein (plasmid) [Persephonella marina EX-H1]|uniref:Putative lipoprotein n=1 Tax=Persephonella marina (strain DSM 14350 / EX-H1) TaxID=123214 RepID=C0QUV5_PERMH|nr:hypothetical protein [Persephonella marina]ACO04996.1 putative lipoprotein [Persephonella marina EX-H1]
MRKLILALVVAGLSTSCYMAAETTQRSVDAGRLTMKQTTMTAKGATAGAVAGAVANIMLVPIANSVEKANIRALAFYCEMENPADKKEYKNCVEWGQAHWNMAKQFNKHLYYGKCHNKFLGFSRGLLKCWDEAFDYAKIIGKDLEKAVYQLKYDYKYSHCMPWRIESEKPEELYQKHLECKKEAREEATEFVKDIKDEIDEYLAKR